MYRYTHIQIFIELHTYKHTHIHIYTYTLKCERAHIYTYTHTLNDRGGEGKRPGTGLLALRRTPNFTAVPVCKCVRVRAGISVCVSARVRLWVVARRTHSLIAVNVCACVRECASV